MDANEQVIQGGTAGENGASASQSPSQSGANVDESNNLSTNSPASQTSSSDHSWIGAVKKESREKGRQEGYQKALEEIREQLATPDATDSQSSPQNAAPVTAQQPPPSTPQNALNPEQIAAQAAQIAKSERYNNIAARACAKYGDDYVNKMNEYNQLAEQMVNQYQNDDMAHVMLMAADVGNEDLVYKLASDEKFRNDVLATNPRLWGNKLIDYQVNSQPTPQQMAATKVNGAPVENAPQSASYGEMSKPSWAELRRQVRDSS